MDHGEQREAGHVAPDDTAMPTAAEIAAWGPTVSVPEAGRAFGISRPTAYDLVAQGAFPCKVIKVGRQFRVITSDLRHVLGLAGAVVADRA